MRMIVTVVRRDYKQVKKEFKNVTQERIDETAKKLNKCRNNELIKWYMVEQFRK